MLREASHFGRVVVTRPRPTAARRSLRKRNFMRILGLTTAAGMVAAFTVPSAFAAPDDDSEAQAHLINLDLNALGLEFDVLDAITTDSGYPSDEGANSANIDVGILNALGLTIPGINLPLIGDGANGGLLDLGDAAAAGLLNGYAASPSAVESLAASGAVGADGAIDVDAGSSTDPARVDLTGLLGQVGVDGLTDAIIDELSLELGALASRAEANEGDIEREYLLAGAELVVSSPLVGGLAGQIQGAVEDISDGVNALLGPEGAIQGALDVLSIAPIMISLPVVGDVLSVDIGSPQLSTTVNLGNITEGLLTQPLVSENGLVSINLSTGEIQVDLAMLHQGNLNNFLPNTELLSAGEVTQIVETAKLLLGEAVDLVTEAVQDALNDTELTLTIDPELQAIGGTLSGDFEITLSGTLAEFTGQTASEPSVSVTGEVTIELPVVPDVTIPAGELLGLVTEPILTQLVPGIGSALNPLLDDASGVVADVVDPLISGVTGVLDPVMTDLLNEIISITVNKQDDGTDATDWHSVSALNLALLPLLDNVVELDLAHSAVRALDEDDASDASIEVAPGSVEVGDTITVDGSGFAPDSAVTITFTDAEGTVVGSEEVTTDGDGNFSGAEFVVPEDTAIGELAVVASDGESEAESSTTVVDDDGSDEDGSDQDGGDQDGSDEDGSDQDGGDQDGSDEDGSDQDGGDQDGSDEDGSDQDGGDQDGSDEDGSDQDGGDQDG